MQKGTLVSNCSAHQQQIYEKKFHNKLRNYIRYLHLAVNVLQNVNTWTVQCIFKYVNIYILAKTRHFESKTTIWSIFLHSANPILTTYIVQYLFAVLHIFKHPKSHKWNIPRQNFTLNLFILLSHSVWYFTHRHLTTQ